MDLDHHTGPRHEREVAFGLSEVTSTPVWPPGFLPEATRSEAVFFKPSQDGGLLEFLLFLEA
ncbi:hypothetical protein POHY109586_15950 [Polaromonas hydrogenivorans]